MLSIENLTKIYTTGDSGGGVRNVSMQVAAGELYTLLGPSGCGKTTTLRCIAGLEEPSVGRMALGERVIFDAARHIFVPANRRELGMVFQSYAVWPHMTVFDNTAFPLRMSGKKLGEAQIRKRVMERLESMGLAAFAARSATQLSGGQQQRLALARALVGEPRLLLLDEPLSNLDALLREQMRNELRRLQKEVGVTAVYVTHDQSEALALSDRIAVMQSGGIVQIGTPRDIYHRPTDGFVAEFIGRSNLLPGPLISHSDGMVLIETALGPVLCQPPAQSSVNGSVAALIRPEQVVVTAANSDVPRQNRFRGQVAHAVFLGDATEYVVRIGCTDILVRSIAASHDEVAMVDVFFPPENTSAVTMRA